MIIYMIEIIWSKLICIFGMNVYGWIWYCSKVCWICYQPSMNLCCIEHARVMEIKFGICFLFRKQKFIKRLEMTSHWLMPLNLEDNYDYLECSLIIKLQVVILNCFLFILDQDWPTGLSQVLIKVIDASKKTRLLVWYFRFCNEPMAAISWPCTYH